MSETINLMQRTLLPQSLIFLVACTPGISGYGNPSDGALGNLDAGRLPDGAPIPVTDGGVVISDDSRIRTEASVPVIGPTQPSPVFFNSCGGMIINPADGTPNAAEYRRQAGLLTREVLNCRLGPSHSDLFPGQPDARPTAYLAPRIECPQCGNNQLYPSFYQLGAYSTGGSSAFGQIYGQVVHYSDSTAGMESAMSFTWFNNAVSEQMFLLGMSPVRFTSGNFNNWGSVFGADNAPRQTLDIGRSQLAEAVGAIAIFQNRYIGGLPDFYGSASNYLFQLPDGYQPTSIAMSNASEFAFVTAWNTTDLTGHLLVIGLSDALPTLGDARKWIRDAATLADYDRASYKILGDIELPIHTPTSVAVSFDNGLGHFDTYLGPRVTGNTSHDNGLDFSSPDTRRSLQPDQPRPRSWFMAQSGYAVVLSRWENRAVFIDLQGLADFTRKYFAGTQAHYEEAMALRGGPAPPPGTSPDPRNGPDRWPWTFAYERSAHGGEVSLPIVANIEVPHPTAVLAGRYSALDSETVKVHIASVDGTITTYSVGALGTIAPGAGPVQRMFTTATGPNPVSMQWPSPWRGNISINAYNDDFLVLSRGAREISFISTTASAGMVTRRLQDTRMTDPVVINVNTFAYANIVSVGDWSGQKVINYRIGATDAQLVRPGTAFPIGGGGEFECGGETPVAGNVYRLSFANVP